MALRALILRNKLDIKKRELEALRAKDSEIQRRETELGQAIEEMTDETSEEDRKTVEDEVEDFESEKKEHEQKKNDLEDEIRKIEEDIQKEEKSQERAAGNNAERTGGEDITMNTRSNFFGVGLQERNAMFAQEEVKEFIERMRTCIKEKRAITNVGLLIPEVFLPLIKQKTEETSKLMKYVTVQTLTGQARQNIMGEIPEAYWDEMCAAIKEVDLAFYNMEMDGYKVSGYFAVCNATYEDSDVDLAAEFIEALGKAIGKAIDKAIIYGKNVKMPMGIVTSLMLKQAPEGYPYTARAWEDLSTTHIISGTSAASTGMKLFQDIVKASGVIDNDYDTGNIVWLMNKKTRTKLITESMNVNSAAAIVAGMSNSMPVIGGDIVEFKYIPDDTIIFGYFKNYILVERAGTKISQSDHVRFLEDQTVFRGTARYDGDLAIREAFAVYGIGKAPNTTSPLFAGEKPADSEQGGE